MRPKIFILIFVFSFSSISCFDLYEKTINIDKDYYVESDPASDFKTLYFDLKNGDAIERVRNIKAVGCSEKYIIVQVEQGFYFIEKNKDNQFLDSNDVIGERQSDDYFQNWLKSNKDFEFDYAFY